ncbi:glyoxylase-like metal-dependent hydrolase (beta-lactamase superfamily II) [Anoxybacillus tepidamans]|uniref:Glyoxylase-like metal-dependent hydrolase (Beta-lactamase superfamily II) n=1 Tax=Anoxybacteroides tepidamans TaxID=265948 RepID=A0A7W8ITC0_9BACL|nr:MBL fold metallo-hydrolase [Anoxybacillus tepidamans]MBB5326286.1 glyoxylase-like metal-dependent hydrolase (beta-lactamase superfamily II) [Anoxybacillus tepidamans]
MGKEEVYRIAVPTPFPVGDVNMYLVKGDCLTLVDAGVKTEEAWHVFKRQLNELGYEPADIEQVVLTHHHPDHVGLLDYLPESLPVIAHPKAQRWISKDPQFLAWHGMYFERFLIECGIDAAFLPSLPNFRRSLRYSCERSLTTAVCEGDRIDGLAGWTVLETPGHAQSHIVLYREKDGLMIGGDHLLATVSSNPLLEPPDEGETDRPKPLLQYNDSLRKLLRYEITTIVTGHGDDVTAVPELVEKRLAKQKERADQVLEMLKHGPMTVFDVCRRLFPTVYEKEFLLTMSETVGQLDYLEDIGAVTKRKEGSSYLFYEAVGSR